MSLLEKLKRDRDACMERYKRLQKNLTVCEEEIEKCDADWADFNVAIAALEPAPAEPEAAPYSIDWGNEPAPAEQAPALADPLSAELRSVPGAEEEVRDQSDALAEFMTRPGAVMWILGVTPHPADDQRVEVFFEKGQILDGMASDWDGEVTEERGFIKAYRIISQPEAQPGEDEPADQSEEAPIVAAKFDADEPNNFFADLTGEVSETSQHDPATCPLCIGEADEPETHTDDVRTAEGETVSGDDRIETQSILDDPELIETVERAEATLAAAGGGAYVGLQDPELDADYDAMRERQEAGKKLHFSIFGKVGE